MNVKRNNTKPICSRYKMPFFSIKPQNKAYHIDEFLVFLETITFQLEL